MGGQRNRAKWSLLFVMVLLAGLLSACSLQKEAEPRWLILVTTTELEQSGLLDALIPPYEQASGVKVKRLAVSTKQDLDYARQAGVDVLLFPAGTALDELAGPSPTFPPYQAGPLPTPTPGLTPGPIPPGLPGRLFNERRVALWSELVVLGPPADPFHLSDQKDALSVLKTAANNNAPFVAASPADEPGLAEAEKRLWNQIARFDPPSRGKGYRQVPGDFQNIIETAAREGAYTLVPLDSYLAVQNNVNIKDHLKLVFQGDAGLFMPYELAVAGAIPNQDRDVALARTLVTFLTSQPSQSTIASFTKAGFPHPPYRPYYFPVNFGVL